MSASTVNSMRRNRERRERQRAREAANAHPAKYTAAIADSFERLLLAYVPPPAIVVDPFAGTGFLLDRLFERGYAPFGIELEPEWAASKHVARGTALALPFEDGYADAVITSPTYGNRMADKDLRPSVAGTYAKGLGRLASEGSSCHLQWGPEYRAFHVEALDEIERVLRPGGLFLLNMKNHYRAKEEVDVVGWWWNEVADRGTFRRLVSIFVATPGNRRGANAEARAEGEYVGVFQREDSCRRG